MSLTSLHHSLLAVTSDTYYECNLDQLEPKITSKYISTGTKNLIEGWKLGDSLTLNIIQNSRIPRSFLPISMVIWYGNVFFFLKQDRVYFVGYDKNKNNYRLLTQSVLYKVKHLLGHSQGMYIITTADELPLTTLPSNITHNFIQL